MMRSVAIFPVLALFLFAAAMPVHSEVSAEQQNKIEAASDVLRNALAREEGGIPKDLLSRAHGVAVIPNVVKGAFIAGGRYGEGVMVVRTDKDTWSSPAFISLTGASLGAQVGAEVSDLVLVFNTKKGVDDFKDGKLNLGADVAVVAGPVGGKTDIGEAIQRDADVYTYSSSRGLFAGLSLTGTTVQFDDDANASFYGREGIGPEMIFARGPITEPMAKNAFTCLVAKSTGASPVC